MMMKLCWDVGLVHLLLAMILVIVGTNGDNTKILAKESDKNCSENADSSGIQICATNGTHFVIFPNQCHLREVNQGEGTAEFKKVALTSCDSLVGHTRTYEELEDKSTTVSDNNSESATFDLVYKSNSPATYILKEAVTSTTKSPTLLDRTYTEREVKSTTVSDNDSESTTSYPVYEIVYKATSPDNKIKPITTTMEEEVTSTTTSPIVALVDEVESTTAYPSVKTANEFRKYDLESSIDSRISRTWGDINVELQKEPQLDGANTIPKHDKNDDYANAITKLELEGSQVIYAPLIERSDFEDGPIVEHPYPSYDIPSMNNFLPKREQSHLSFEFSPMANILPNTEQLFLSNDIPLNTYFGPEKQQLRPPYVDQLLKKYSNMGQHYFSHKIGEVGEKSNYPSLTDLPITNFESPKPKFKPIIEKSFSSFESSPVRTFVPAKGQVYPSYIDQILKNYANVGQSYFSPTVPFFKPISEKSFPSYETSPTKNFANKKERNTLLNTQPGPASRDEYVATVKRNNKINFPEPPVSIKSYVEIHDQQQNVPNVKSSYNSPIPEHYLERKNYEDRPMVEYVKPIETEEYFPLYGSLLNKNFRPRNEELYPSYQSRTPLNYEMNNEKSFSAAETTWSKKREPFASNKASQMKNTASSWIKNPFRNPQEIVVPIYSCAAQKNPVQRQGTNLPCSSTSPKKRHSIYGSNYLPCAKVFNPVCAIFAGVKSTFINECLVNLENFKTGGAWTILSNGVCAEDYGTSNKGNRIRNIDTRSKDKKSPIIDQTVEEQYGPDIIYAPAIFRTEILEDPLGYQDYYGTPNEQVYFEKSGDYSSSIQKLTTYDEANEKKSPFSANYDWSSKYVVEPLPPTEKDSGVSQLCTQESRNAQVSSALNFSPDETEPHCRPGAEKKPTSDDNLPIDKVPFCSSGRGPVCATYKNKTHSFGNTCELILRNMLKNETWAPIYTGKCRCPEICTLGLEPICVSRNGVKETMPNECFFKRFKAEDPFSTWEFISKGECPSNRLSPTFRRLANRIDPLTIKVPDSENSNFAFPNMRKSQFPLEVNPFTVNVHDQSIKSPVFQYLTESRRHRGIKETNYENKPEGPPTQKATTEFTSSGSMASTTSNPYDESGMSTTTTTIRTTAASEHIKSYKKPITRFVVSAKKEAYPSIYGANPNSVIMRLAKVKGSNILH